MVNETAVAFGRHLRFSAMAHSYEKRRAIPIEVILVLAINVVATAFGYFAIMMWGLFSN
jgi:hypothetical protein